MLTIVTFSKQLDSFFDSLTIVFLSTHAECFTHSTAMSPVTLAQSHFCVLKRSLRRRHPHIADATEPELSV